VPATTIVALHGIQYRGPQAEPILIPLGGATVPLIVAQRATELGLEFSADNREGKAALAQHQQGLSLSKIYADRIGHQTLGAFRDVGVDVGLWMEAERARLAQRAA
jgi:hypothetical protein